MKTKELEMKTIHVLSSGLSDVGLKREVNEDSFSIDDDLGFYIVADGMGGHLAGEVASQIAVHMINKCFRQWSTQGIPEDYLYGYPDLSLSRNGNYILSSIRLANRVIHEMACQYQQYHGMGTTVVLLAVLPDMIITANVGDSRIYMIRNGHIEQLSKDHTVVADQIEMGIMTKEEAKASPMKHILTRNLGSVKDVEADIFEIEPQSKDHFILCTDGITDLLSDEDIYNLVKAGDSDKKICKKLVDVALERGGHDNITVVAVSFPDSKKVKFGLLQKTGSFLVEGITSIKKIIAHFTP